MYSIVQYGSMIADRPRTAAYRQALQQVVKADSVVLDIGTGTGIFALSACQFGARHVYAIEPDDSIQVAREIAAANGFAERIEFIQDVSTRVTLPERADVIISDLRGVLPWLQNHIPSIVDARQRLLKPGGTMIPQRDTLWAAPAEAPKLYSQLTVASSGNGYGLDLRAANRFGTNTWSKGRVKMEELLAEPFSGAPLDYSTVSSPNLKTEFRWCAAREGTCHGICVWFDSILADGVRISNAPDVPELIYGSAFFPWSEPVTLAAGDAVSFVLQANLVGEDYIWRWESCVLEQGTRNLAKAQFRQSTFYGVPLTPGRLQKRAANFTPALNEDGRIDQFILALIEQGVVLSDIAEQVSQKFPVRFATTRAALTRVGELAQKYSR